MPAHRGPAASAVRLNPAPPATLAPRAHATWARVWSFGAYQESDATAIAMYADLTARLEFVNATLQAEGLTISTSRGGQALHPLVKVQKDTEARLLALAAVLGLTPESRLRLGIATLETQSKWDEFMASSKRSQS